MPLQEHLCINGNYAALTWYGTLDHESDNPLGGLDLSNSIEMFYEKMQGSRRVKGRRRRQVASVQCSATYSERVIVINVTLSYYILEVEEDEVDYIASEYIL